MELIVKTFHGLEEVLATEMRNLGLEDVQPVKRAVVAHTDLQGLYKANLHLRTALRVLVPIQRFTAPDEDQLYRILNRFPWEKWLRLDQTFAIDSTVSSPIFRHSKYVALRAKDALVDRFRNQTGKRPSVDTQFPDLRINLHVSNTDFTLSFDSSGESLHRRGYRAPGHRAPLNEVLAAGMLLIAGWDCKTPLVDPMCGSGTIVLEAGLMAANRAPGIQRKRYGFMTWKDFDETLWKKLYTQAIVRESPSEVPIVGGDISGRALDMAKDAAHRAKLPVNFTWMNRQFNQHPPQTDPGLIVMNPPYGERLDRVDVENLYQGIGDQLKQQYAGFAAWILSSNRDALKRVGLRPSAKKVLFNGPLECRFQKYDLFRGKKGHGGKVAVPKKS